MKEDLLHFIWQYCHFDIKNLVTTKGLPITIHGVGRHNTNAGPDFKYASTRIGEVQWHGDVEMHLKSSDWYKHKHHLDRKTIPLYCM